MIRTKGEVAIWLSAYGIKNYVINDDLSVNVDGDVRLKFKAPEMELNNGHLMIAFNIVTGNFICENNSLTSLTNCPKIIGKSFDCSGNKLINLKDGPRQVGGSYNCSYNQLTSLEGSPEVLGYSYDCEGNNLETLRGITKKINQHLICNKNKIKSLNDIGSVSGYVSCFSNKIESLEEVVNKIGDCILYNKNELPFEKGLSIEEIKEYYLKEKLNKENIKLSDNNKKMKI